MSENHLGIGALMAGERAKFFTVPAASPLECLSARFRRHAYASHTHDSYVVGTIVDGCETFLIGGERHYAGPGDLCLIDPGVVHDGQPVGEGYAYRISYPTTAFLLDAATDAAERSFSGSPHFAAPIVRDPELAGMLARAHALTETTGPSLEADELLLRFFVGLLARHGGAGRSVREPLARVAPCEPGPVARALAYLDAHFAEAIDLATLAGIAGVRRTRLIRALRRETGMTPHAWLTDRRVRAARIMLGDGAAPADVAVACGFYDQSHLNRVFKSRIGVSPGAFRAAHHSRRPGGPR